MADEFETWLYQLNETFVASTTASLDIEEALTIVTRRAASDAQKMSQGTEQLPDRVLAATDTSRGAVTAATSITDLLRRAVDNDPRAWDEIVRRYGKLVSATVQSFRLPDADMRNVVQMTWQRLAENADRVQVPERLGGWLATTARRECLHILRRTQRFSGPSDTMANTVADPTAQSEQYPIEAYTGNVGAQASESVRRLAQLTLTPGDRSMQWRVLGPVEAVVGGQLVDLGPPRQRALFGLLLSCVDRPVAVDTVIDELWLGDPSAAVMATVRAYVSNLRRVLEPDRPPRAPATVLRTRAPGYLLNSQGVDFDVRQFTEHAAIGRAVLSRPNPVRALGEFDAALELWRGQPYADMSDAKWAAPEIARLEELRLSVIEDRCAAQLALGDHHGAVAKLTVHVRCHPLREHGCALLALALYRAGREAEALDVLRATRARLTEDLGMEPGTALQQLERDIHTHAPNLD